MGKQAKNPFQASRQKKQPAELDRSDSKSAENENEDLDTESLDEALNHWISEVPPFIDHAIPRSMKSGENMQVWKASENAAPVKENSARTFVTCRVWKDSNYKYWTCDIDGWRYIVGGMGVANSRGYFAWFIWHGLEFHGFTKKRVLWTNTATFTPKVKPLQDGTFLGQTDSNHFMREQDNILRNLKKGGSPVQLSNDSPTSDRARLSNKRQRETSPSSQLKSPSPTNDSDSIQRSPLRPKRRRLHAGFYTQNLSLEHDFPDDQGGEEFNKASLVEDYCDIEGKKLTRTNPGIHSVIKVQKYVAPTANSPATAIDVDAIQASDDFSSLALSPAKRTPKPRAQADCIQEKPFAPAINNQAKRKKSTNVRPGVTTTASAKQSSRREKRHSEPVAQAESEPPKPTEPRPSTPNNAASSQPPPPREIDEPPTAHANVDKPEPPLSEEDQLKREIYALKQEQIRLKMEQNALALEQKEERLAKTQKAKAE